MKMVGVALCIILLLVLTGCKGLEDESFKPIFKDYSDTSYLTENTTIIDDNMTTIINSSAEENDTSQVEMNQDEEKE